MQSGGYRVYYVTSGGPNSIASAFSSDGLTITAEGTRIPAADGVMYVDPAVVYVDGYGYLMALGRVPNTAIGNAVLMLAYSSDGLNWTLDNKVLKSNTSYYLADPTMVVSGGTIRIYYQGWQWGTVAAGRHAGRDVDGRAQSMTGA